MLQIKKKKKKEEEEDCDQQSGWASPNPLRA